jgi:hypothetical protein
LILDHLPRATVLLQDFLPLDHTSMGYDLLDEFC